MNAWARGLAATLLLACSAASAWGACTASQILPVAQRTVLGHGAHDGTQPVALPDALPRALRSEQVRLRYVLDVSACASAPSAALWLFRVSAPFRVTAAGRPLALLNARALLSPEVLGAGPLTLDDVHNGRIPALFALPPGATQVEVELLTLPYLPSGIVRAQIGPTDLLLPAQAGAAELAVAYIDAASAVLLVVSLLALALWLPRRADRSLLWLAVACGLWGLRGLVFFGHKVYLEPMAFEQFNSLNVLLTSSALSASLLHVLGGMRQAEGRSIAAAVLLGLAGFALSAWAGRGGSAARALALFLPFCMVSWVLWRAWKARSAQAPRRNNAAVITGLGILLASGAHDLLLLGGVLPPDWPSVLFWGFVALLMGMAATSGRYVVLTLNRAERSNEELELHVARKTEELERSYERLREREQEGARVQERERLLRDMHDGLGAQLMTALRGVERGALAPSQIAQSLQDSLDELRLLMDSADMGHYLPGALAAWRNRWDGRLAAAGVALDWRIDESLDQVQLSSEKALQVMRILQEAATNVVKHAHARHMSLAAQVRRHEGRMTLCIEIADDGVGLPPEPARAGARGLKNMRYRAGEIGAQIQVLARQAPATGCLVALTLPLE
ncbi:MAG: hypothetical protein EOO25_02720 [Comamonadaceae bacterium]|nr:MAG: hypothetical protein EOO25_02720 [Comamonadaceae bacterium]